jgi:hypothetical protein
MDIYILLSHEHFECGDCGSSEYNLFYQYSKCLNKTDFEKFITDNNLRFSDSSLKLYDKAGFERYEVIIENIEIQ